MSLGGYIYTCIRTLKTQATSTYSMHIYSFEGLTYVYMYVHRVANGFITPNPTQLIIILTPMATDHHRPAVTMMRLVSRYQDVYGDKLYSPGWRAWTRGMGRHGGTQGEGRGYRREGG